MYICLIASSLIIALIDPLNDRLSSGLRGGSTEVFEQRKDSELWVGKRPLGT